MSSRTPWLTRPEIDRLQHRRCLPDDVDRVWISPDGSMIRIELDNPSGDVHQRPDVELTANFDPFRMAPGGDIDFGEVEKALKNAYG